MTGFPNFFGHLDQTQAAEYANYVDIAKVVNCSEHSTEFLCGLLLPECRENEGFILPSRQICYEFYNGSEFYTGCGELIRQLENSEEFLIDCDTFPENPVPVCSANSSDPTTEIDDSESGNVVFYFWHAWPVWAWVMSPQGPGLSPSPSSRPGGVSPSLSPSPQGVSPSPSPSPDSHGLDARFDAFFNLLKCKAPSTMAGDILKDLWTHSRQWWVTLKSDTLLAMDITNIPLLLTLFGIYTWSKHWTDQQS